MSRQMISKPKTTAAAANTQASSSRNLPAQTNLRVAALLKMSKQFRDTPLYLEPGPANRLLLSIKSGEPQEVDFALERLLYASQVDCDPALILFSDFPGLPELLLALIYAYIEDLQAKEIHASKLSWTRSFPTPLHEARTRDRAAEAATILRNLTCEQRNVAFLHTQSDLRQDIVNTAITLFEVSPLTRETETDESLEIHLTLLDIVEMLASEVKLAESVSSKAPEKTDKSNRLVPLLCQICYSNDRAMMLAAYRTLALLAGSEKTSPHNASAFDFDSSTPANPISRAIELLPLQDADISLAVLDLLYSYTQSVLNASLICEKPNLLWILKTLLSKTAIGGARIEEEVERMTREDKETMERKEREFLQQQKETYGPPPVIASLLSIEEFNLIIGVREPKRAIKWMQWVFEAGEEAEVTQVALWQAYKEQFEKYDPQSENKMLPAADVIKHSTDAFPESLPMVQGEPPNKRFIIKGIQVRDRNVLADQLRKTWINVEANEGYFSPTQAAAIFTVLPSHLVGRFHTATDEQILAAGLQILIAADVGVPACADLWQALFTNRPSEVRPFIIRASHWRPQTDSNALIPAGPAFLATLVIRNLARAIKATLPAKGREIDQLGPSIFTVLAGGSGEEESEQNTILMENAEQARNALLSIESELLTFAIGHRAFSPYLAEALGVCMELRKIQGVKEEML